MKHWTELFQEKLQGWWIAFAKSLPNILLAVLVILVFLFIARSIRKVLYKILGRFSFKSSFTNLVVTIIQIVILFIGLFFALDILHLNRAVSSLLAGAGIVGIILGFAFQDITSNFISGIYIALKKPFLVGHTVKTISVWFWIDNHSPPGYMVARHDAIYNIMSALKEKEIPLVLPLSVENLNTVN